MEKVKLLLSDMIDVATLFWFGPRSYEITKQAMYRTYNCNTGRICVTIVATQNQ